MRNGEVVQLGGRVPQSAADGKNVVCESEIGEVRVGGRVRQVSHRRYLSSTFLLVAS